MLEIFSYSFMQRAFIVGNVIAVVAPIIGVFLVLKRLSLIGNTISHVALAGVALGMILGIYPVVMAIIISVIASLGIEQLRKKYQNYAELSLSVMLATGLGLATILISLSHNNAGIFGYLFGSIALISSRDLFVVLPLGLFIVAIIFIFYYGFFFIAFNEKEARLAGIPVGILNVVFMIMVSITIALSMRIVGALLIASLITLPVASALQVARSFKETIFFSVIFALIAVNAGLTLSFYQDLAPGGSIILVSVASLLMVLLYKKIKINLQKEG